MSFLDDHRRAVGEEREILLLEDREGTKLGRVSPAGSGPKNFEPCCAFDGWRKVQEPSFPLKRCYYLEELLLPA